ncbi:hypothetical protein FQN60_016509, partial [Etheostoma spectabile]
CPHHLGYHGDLLPFCPSASSSSSFPAPQTSPTPGSKYRPPPPPFFSVSLCGCCTSNAAACFTERSRVWAAAAAAPPLFASAFIPALFLAARTLLRDGRAAICSLQERLMEAPPGLLVFQSTLPALTPFVPSSSCCLVDAPFVSMVSRAGFPANCVQPMGVASRPSIHGQFPTLVGVRPAVSKCGATSAKAQLPLRGRILGRKPGPLGDVGVHPP